MNKGVDQHLYRKEVLDLLDMFEEIEMKLQGKEYLNIRDLISDVKDNLTLLLRSSYYQNVTTYEVHKLIQDTYSKLNIIRGNIQDWTSESYKYLISEEYINYTIRYLVSSFSTYDDFMQQMNLYSTLNHRDKLIKFIHHLEHHIEEMKKREDLLFHLREAQEIMSHIELEIYQRYQRSFTFSEDWIDKINNMAEGQ